MIIKTWHSKTYEMQLRPCLENYNLKCTYYKRSLEIKYASKPENKEKIKYKENRRKEIISIRVEINDVN